MFLIEVSDSDSLRGIAWLHCIGDDVVSSMMNFAQQIWKAAFAVVPFADLSLDIHRFPLPAPFA